MSQDLIPVTVITGFLGSGKTTLINRVLTEHHGIRFAVIENEFGEVGIDQDLVLNEKEEIIEMNNGCICCTVRGDLIRIIKKLAADKNPPEHILIETTGLADPSPVAQTFLTDPDIAAKTFLDSIVTLVDAVHVAQQLASTPEAKDQIAFADIILINKTDLVSPEELKKVEDRVREINRFAKIIHSQKGDVDLKTLFNVGGFDVNRALTINPKFMEIEYPFEYGGLYELEKGTYTLSVSPNGEEKAMKIIFAGGPKDTSVEGLDAIANAAAILFSYPPNARAEGSVIPIAQELSTLSIQKQDTRFSIEIPESRSYVLFTEHLPAEFSLQLRAANGTEIKATVSKEFRPAHSHDESVSSVGIEVKGDLDSKALMHFINSITRAFGNELYRYKGIFSVAGEPEKIVLQGVHMLFELQPIGRWKEDEERKNTMVFIGKDLDRNILTQGFLSCVAQAK